MRRVKNWSMDSLLEQPVLNLHYFFTLKLLTNYFNVPQLLTNDFASIIDMEVEVDVDVHVVVSVGVASVGAASVEFRDQVPRKRNKQL